MAAIERALEQERDARQRADRRLDDKITYFDSRAYDAKVERLDRHMRPYGDGTRDEDLNSEFDKKCGRYYGGRDVDLRTYSRFVHWRRR